MAFLLAGIENLMPEWFYIYRDYQEFLAILEE